MSAAPFREDQRFAQPWVIVTEILSLAITAALAIFIVVTKKAEPVFAAIPLLVVMAIVILFWLISLQVSITHDKISYRFRPFQLKWTNIPKETIRQTSIVTYDPIGEYGGWGIRYGKGGKAYTVKGHSGISINLVNGKHLLIGTSNPKEAQRALESLGFTR